MKIVPPPELIADECGIVFRQWVAWRYITRDGKKTKVLFDARTGRPADSTDPATWSSFRDMEMSYYAGRYDGLGFVFSKPHDVFNRQTGEVLRRIEIEDPFCGIDLDDSLTERGELKDWAIPIVAGFATRTEISPSGKGVKMWVRGKLPRNGEEKCRAHFKKDGVNIELYDRARFFTVTGQLLPGTTPEIQERQAELTAFHAKLFPPAPPLPPRTRPRGEAEHIDDNEAIRRARAAKNGAKFRALYDEGSIAGYKSQSEADLGLCTMIAFWVGGDPERVDRIFRESALCDEKWLHRADYRKTTINKAVGNCDTYAAHRRGGAA